MKIEITKEELLEKKDLEWIEEEFRTLLMEKIEEYNLEVNWNIHYITGEIK